MPVVRAEVTNDVMFGLNVEENHAYCMFGDSRSNVFELLHSHICVSAGHISVELKLLLLVASFLINLKSMSGLTSLPILVTLCAVVNYISCALAGPDNWKYPFLEHVSLSGLMLVQTCRACARVCIYIMSS